MAPRHEYRLDLRSPLPAPEAGGRPPAPSDREALAALMLDAYAGTIDSDGETMDDALAEVDGFFAGRDTAPLLAASRVLELDGSLAAACLVGVWERRGCPLVAYVLCAPAWKGRGMAAALLAQSVAALADAGYSEVRAVITEGNTPSERLFARAGFERAAAG